MFDLVELFLYQCVVWIEGCKGGNFNDTLCEPHVFLEKKNIYLNHNQLQFTVNHHITGIFNVFQWIFIAIHQGVLKWQIKCIRNLNFCYGKIYDSGLIINLFLGPFLGIGDFPDAWLSLPQANPFFAKPSPFGRNKETGRKTKAKIIKRAKARYNNVVEV